MIIKWGISSVSSGKWCLCWAFFIVLDTRWWFWYCIVDVCRNFSSDFDLVCLDATFLTIWLLDELLYISSYGWCSTQCMCRALTRMHVEVSRFHRAIGGFIAVIYFAVLRCHPFPQVLISNDRGRLIWQECDRCKFHTHNSTQHINPINFDHVLLSVSRSLQAELNRGDFEMSFNFSGSKLYSLQPNILVWILRYKMSVYLFNLE